MSIIFGLCIAGHFCFCDLRSHKWMDDLWIPSFP